MKLARKVTFRGGEKTNNLPTSTVKMLLVMFNNVLHQMQKKKSVIKHGLLFFYDIMD